MIVSNFKVQTAVLFALVCISGTVAFLPPVMGQPPTAEKKDENAKNVAGQRSEADKDKLQGKWQITSITMQDKVFKREDKLDAWKDTFDGEVIIEGDRVSHAGAASEAKIKLDDTRDPKQITVQDKDGKLTFRGIYAVDGETITICINGDGTDVRRPEKFVTKEGTPLLLIALKKSPAKK